MARPGPESNGHDVDLSLLVGEEAVVEDDGALLDVAHVCPDKALSRSAALTDATLNDVTVTNAETPRGPGSPALAQTMTQQPRHW